MTNRSKSKKIQGYAVSHSIATRNSFRPAKPVQTPICRESEEFLHVWCLCHLQAWLQFLCKRRFCVLQMKSAKSFLYSVLNIGTSTEFTLLEMCPPGEARRGVLNNYIWLKTKREGVGMQRPKTIKEDKQCRQADLCLQRSIFELYLDVMEIIYISVFFFSVERQFLQTVQLRHYLMINSWNKLHRPLEKVNIN